MCMMVFMSNFPLKTHKIASWKWHSLFPEFFIERPSSSNSSVKGATASSLASNWKYSCRKSHFLFYGNIHTENRMSIFHFQESEILSALLFCPQINLEKTQLDKRGYGWGRGHTICYVAAAAWLTRSFRFLLIVLIVGPKHAVYINLSLTQTLHARGAERLIVFLFVCLYSSRIWTLLPQTLVREYFNRGLRGGVGQCSTSRNDSVNQSKTYDNHC